MAGATGLARLKATEEAGAGPAGVASGLISCVLRPTLRPRHKFTVAFTPKLERGTEILVKFLSASGKRSYAVFETR